jgi:hypothetical protein
MRSQAAALSVALGKACCERWFGSTCPGAANYIPKRAKRNAPTQAVNFVKALWLSDWSIMIRNRVLHER